MAQNSPPQVSNVNFQQRVDGTFIIDIAYDVIDDDADQMLVTVQASDDGGLTWDFTCSHLTGDVGPGINSGLSKQIAWDFALDHPSMFTPLLQIKVIADDATSFGVACPGIPQVVYEGTTYHTVQIAGQCWFKENLNVGQMLNSSEFSYDNGVTEKFCYDNDPANCLVYGAMYEWDELMNYRDTVSQGLCPAGWHVPGQAEYLGMVNALGSDVVAGSKLRETGTGHWYAPNYNATNETGFTLLAGGACAPPGAAPFDFFGLYETEGLWTSKGSKNESAWVMSMYFEDSYVYTFAQIARTRYYARCMKDNCTTKPVAYAGPDQLFVTGSPVFTDANYPQAGETAGWSVQSGMSEPADYQNPQTPVNITVPTESILIWTVSNACTSASDYLTIKTGIAPNPPCSDVPTVDYGGQTYNTVQIGSQCWMRENLNIGSFRTHEQGQQHNGVPEKFCFDDKPENCVAYGGLYQWGEMMKYVEGSGTRGICPDGWHIPSDGDWCKLFSTIDPSFSCYDLGLCGNTVGTSMREPGFEHWDYQNYNSNNASGFTAFAGGFLNSAYWAYELFGSNAFFATSNSSDGLNRYYYSLDTYSNNATRFTLKKSDALSVRCMRDTCASWASANAGMDQLSVPISTAWLDGNTLGPEQYGNWALISGTGGSILSPGDAKSMFTGLPDSSYILQWSVTGLCNAASDEVTIHFFGSQGLPCPGIPTVAYGGQTYNTVKIGNQCWMKQNLNVGNMINLDQEPYDNGVPEKYCYDNDPLNCNVYGGLYKWNEMMQYVNTSGAQGLCPSGWHIPDDSEWCTMMTFLDNTSSCPPLYGDLGAITGTLLKESGTSHWIAGIPGDNSSGFTALGAGWKQVAAATTNLNEITTFWSSSEHDPQFVWIYSLQNTASAAYRTYYGAKQLGYSVRCLKNDCANVSTANAGPDQALPGCTQAQLAGSALLPGETGMWATLSGVEGTFTAPQYPNSLLNGIPGETYILSWTVTNACGNSTSDLVYIQFLDLPSYPCPSGATISYEGQTYHTVLVGDQCWLRENLNYGQMVNSTNTGLGHTDASNNGIVEKYCYDNLPANCEIYGGLYDWNEMMNYTGNPGSQGICPTGWHVPTDAEFCMFFNQLDATVNCTQIGFPGTGTDAGAKVRSVCGQYWNTPNIGATNSIGFSLQGSGTRVYTGGFAGLLATSEIWTSSSQTEGASSLAYYWSVSGSTPNVFHGLGDVKNYGNPVRCMKPVCYTSPVAEAGPDQVNLTSTITVLAGNTPAIGETGVWTIVSGTGGTVFSATNPISSFFGIAGQTYTLSWTVSNACGTTVLDYVTVALNNVPGIPCAGLPVVTYGGQSYNTVQIGTQCWFRENLNAGTMVVSVPNVSGPYHSDVSNNGIIEKYCYNNEPLNCNKYGALYDWDELMQYTNVPGTQGICPSGWHIPTDADFCNLAHFLDASVNCGSVGQYTGANAATSLKTVSGLFWNYQFGTATNTSGFSLFGGGYRHPNGTFTGLSSSGQEWSSSTSSSSQVYYWSASNFDGRIMRNLLQRPTGNSLRCLKN